MSENKLSRRTFLTAGSALVVLHTPVVRALESSDCVNIQDYNPKDWVASFRQAFKEGQTVVVPKELECKDLNTAVVIPLAKRYNCKAESAAMAVVALFCRMDAG